jgi:hypothetical protein
LFSACFQINGCFFGVLKSAYRILNRYDFLGLFNHRTVFIPLEERFIRRIELTGILKNQQIRPTVWLPRENSVSKIASNHRSGPPYSGLFNMTKVPHAIALAVAKQKQQRINVLVPR